MPIDPRAFAPDDSAKTRAALGITGAAGSGLGALLRSPAFATIGRGASGLAQLARIPSIVGSNASDARKALGTAGAVTGAASQFSRIPAVQSALPAATSALNSGVSLGTNAAGGAANVPYLSAAGAGLNIADIAMSDRPDDQKAYDAAHQVGRTVADAYLPIVGGFAADAVSGGLRHLLFSGGNYMPVRRQEHSALPKHLRGLTSLMGMAPDQATLDDSLSAWGGQGFRADQENGGLVLRGTHLNLAGAEQQVNDLYKQRQALFAAAKAGNPAGLAQLAQDRERYGAFKGGADLFSTASTMDPDLAVPNWTMAATLGGDPRVEDSVAGVLDDWMEGANSTIRQGGQLDPTTIPLITKFTDAALAMGLDLEAAAERKRKRQAEEALFQQSMSSPGGGE